MQHHIDTTLTPQAEEMAHAVESCVHCGFCLPTCPTYVVMGEEMDSPRGRIFLMKEVLEGGLALDEAQPYLDNCLGCLACVTACPSGVEYGELISPFRAWSEPQRRREPLERLQRFFVLETLPYPWRFRVAALLGKFARPFKGLMPGSFGTMLELLPQTLPKAERLPEVYPAQGERRARVALLAGCAQGVLAPTINWAALRVLSRNGVEVVVPEQACCGALAMHVGEEARALATARKNLTAFPDDVDAIIATAAGCGSGMKEYGLLFKGSADEDSARAFAGRVMDVSLFLDGLGLTPPEGLERPLKVAYHDACHLAHAQGVRSAPRRLLEAVPNLELLEPLEWELCCGSAGTYNIERPDTARELGERKARNLIDTGAEAVATGNIGCMTQLQTHLRALGKPLPVLHTVEVLDRAYGSR
ncbi:MAG: heterodisulfide reductase-related iron-sulfur binding cluster [Deinococcota bacterium]|jgi:glycolate oxidase iron-sulfur subunit|nr:heterodisulfide reductase-related iron-sulfur binding cluster [Deinococcota bacterium]